MRRHPRGIKGGQFAPGERCEQIEAAVPLEAEDTGYATAQQAMKEADDAAIAAISDLLRCLEETGASDISCPDHPELVAARQTADEALSEAEVQDTQLKFARSKQRLLGRPSQRS